jgi:hypothetical protein
VKITKEKLRNLVVEEINQLTGLNEPDPLEEFMFDFEKLWRVLTESETWGTALQNSPDMREKVFHAILRHIKDELGLQRGMDTGQGYFE